MNISARSDTAQGKRLLMVAALKLAADSRSVTSLGLRELAREAGLNPNTFYRHFKNIDELGLAIVEDVAGQLRQPLRALRYQAAASVSEASEVAPGGTLHFERGRRVNEETVRLFFNFVAEHPAAFIIGVRELHGASPALRQAVREVMKGFSEDMVEDIGKLALLPGIDHDTVSELATAVTRQMFQMSLDYIEATSDQREVIIDRAARQMFMLFAGAMALKGLQPLQAMISQPKIRKSSGA
ncbi:TetR family transcriptional regulator [Mangrovitalea sediminis]|uniref:TetR family transcriptional regulator n=1 Tax=Mangrovitalea sediminis TaxID=1982043 RepID=UPI0018E9818B|nr:TetR family transcriptional regulator [Mangrovitalea sediminis]